MEVLLILLGLLAAVIVVLYGRRRPRTREQQLCRVFRLDPQQVTLKGSDLAGGQDKQFLSGDGLLGVPDAVFEHRVNGEIIIGEAKSRYHRSVITERYQITLYMGVAGGNAGRPVRGIFRYGCGTVVPIAFDVDLYHQLLSQVPACREAEPSRVYRRLQLLRGLEHEQIKSIFPRG